MIVVALIVAVVALVAAANAIRFTISTAAALRDLDARADRIDAAAARACVALQARLHHVEAAVVAHVRHDTAIAAAVVGAALTNATRH